MHFLVTFSNFYLLSYSRSHGNEWPRALHGGGLVIVASGDLIRDFDSVKVKFCIFVIKILEHVRQDKSGLIFVTNV